MFFLIWIFPLHLGTALKENFIGSYAQCSFSLSKRFYPQISKVQNRLLKVCYVPATSAGLSRLLFLQWPLTVIMKQTRQAVCALKQSILLRCLWFYPMILDTIKICSFSAVKTFIGKKYSFQNQVKNDVLNHATVKCFVVLLQTFEERGKKKKNETIIFKKRGWKWKKQTRLNRQWRHVTFPLLHAYDQ